jgi:NTE family protein
MIRAIHDLQPGLEHVIDLSSLTEMPPWPHAACISSPDDVMLSLVERGSVSGSGGANVGLRREGSVRSPLMGKKIAVILAGAVARGAFEAGALEVLAKSDIEIVRIVAASSGALNATLLAGGVCAGDIPRATSTLASLWETQASLTHVFDVNFRDVFRLEGLSDSAKLHRLLEANVAPCADPRPVQVKFVVTSLRGVQANIGAEAARTHELVLSFDESDFKSPEGLKRVFDAATASAAFPFAFAPADLGAEYGPCVDGGVVNNTPLKYALGDDIAAVVVIACSPQSVALPTGHGGMDLLGDFADIVVDERLYRDLREAEDVNRSLERLDKLNLGADDLRRVMGAIGWTGRRQIEIVAIRPAEVLPGNLFSGFTSGSLRQQYLGLGRDAASKALGDAWGVSFSC